MFKSLLILSYFKYMNFVISLGFDISIYSKLRKKNIKKYSNPLTLTLNFQEQYILK